MYKNSNYQHVYNEEDIITGWLSGRSIDQVTCESLDPINIYNAWCSHHDNGNTIEAAEENTSANYVNDCISNWNMPDEYKNMDIWNYLLDQCPDTVECMTRVTNELYEYEKRNMIPVLKFLKYLVDMCNSNNVVLGVGRGSSVASYCLYLLGVHRIDSIKYDLDIKEFLK